MASLARVEVCVLSWNTRDLTVKALRHLLDSDQGVDVRLLVRDNASSDGSAQAIAREVPEAELDYGDVNLGFAGGMNTLLARTTADWVFVLNSDAWPEQGAIGAMVRSAEQHGGATVAPLLLRPDGTLEFSALPFPSLRLSLLYATGLNRLVPAGLASRWLLPPAWRHDHGRFVGWAVGAALLVPREVLDRVGGFDERYFMYGEDVDWFWRAHRLGLRTWFEPTAVVRHVGGVSAEHRYQGTATRAKAAASVRVVAAHRGPLVGRAYQYLELLTALRRWVAAVLTKDQGGRAHWAVVARAFLHPSPVESSS